MANLFDPPPIFDLPLVKGQDLIIDFKNKTPGSNPPVFIDYDDGVTVSVTIDTNPPTEAEAEITGHHAVCRLESTVTDDIPKGVLWRCTVSIPGSPVADRVPTNGVTARYDGRPPK